MFGVRREHQGRRSPLKILPNSSALFFGSTMHTARRSRNSEMMTTTGGSRRVIHFQTSFR